MKDFQVALTFLALSENSAPRATNLLFYNQHENQTARGYYTGPTGTLMLIGAQWEPTHFAIYEEQVEQQSGRLRTFGVKNEAGEYIELEASSHKDAATRYREQHGIVGAVKLCTTDTEALFGRRVGKHHINHDIIAHDAFEVAIALYGTSWGWTLDSLTQAVRAEEIAKILDEKSIIEVCEKAFWLGLTSDLRIIIANTSNRWVAPQPDIYHEVVALRAENIAQHQINKSWVNRIDADTLKYLIESTLADVWPAPLVSTAVVEAPSAGV